MKKVIAVLLILVVLIFGKKGWSFIQKFRHAKRLKISVEGIRFPKLSLKNLIGDIALKVRLNLANFSPSSFNLEQVSVDVFNKAGEQIGTQQNPLREPILINSNQNNLVTTDYLISSSAIRNLIRDAGGGGAVASNYLTEGKYGIPILLKGFVVAEGVKVEVNEKLEV